MFCKRCLFQQNHDEQFLYKPYNKLHNTPLFLSISCRVCVYYMLSIIIINMKVIIMLYILLLLLLLLCQFGLCGFLLQLCIQEDTEIRRFSCWPMINVCHTHINNNINYPCNRAPKLVLYIVNVILSFLFLTFSLTKLPEALELQLLI